MNSAWFGLVAAVVGGLITGLFTLGGVMLASRRSDEAALKARRAQAYSELVGVCGVVLFTANTARVLMGYHSGVSEGIGVLTRSRNPPSSIEIDNLFHRDLIPVFVAASRIRAIGSAGAGAQAGKIIAQVGVVIQAACEPGEARRKAATLVRGQEWTEQQRARLQEECDKLIGLRDRFAELARHEVGLATQDLDPGAQTTRVKA